MSELKRCEKCKSEDVRIIQSKTLWDYSFRAMCNRCGNTTGWAHSAEDAFEIWNTRPIEDELQRRIDELTAELAALKSEIVNLSKKVTDYEKELRQLHKYDNTCSTCRYLDENRDCVLGIRCVNYTLWQGRIL